ncbi:hypothetical protein Skr01_24960 [Sphaerisporangium krabiense]|nr:hypothetical protein Skr01_24960 [Sphaerisporangium krabiense]
MAPAVAALTGVGGVLMWRAYRERRAVTGWALPAGVALTAGWAFVVLRRTPGWTPWLAYAVAALGAAAVLGLVLIRLGRRGRARLAVVALALGLAGGLAGPAAYALTPLSSPVNGSNPTAGPQTGPGGTGGSFRPRGMGAGGVDGARTTVDAGLAGYLRRNRGDAEWLVAVSSAREASPLILATGGEPVLAMGGFTGSDPAMTVAKLQRYVAAGRVKYVVLGGGVGGPRGQDGEVATWVRSHGAEVPAPEYGGTGTGGTLYRLS